MNTHTSEITHKSSSIKFGPTNVLINNHVVWFKKSKNQKFNNYLNIKNICVPVKKNNYPLTDDKIKDLFLEHLTKHNIELEYKIIIEDVKDTFID